MVNTKKIINLGNNINLTLIKTEKFKSNLISLYVQRLLDEKEIFENARQHSRKIAEEYGTKRFGKRVESCYEKVLLERECEKNESAVICEESTSRLKKWSGESHGYARRIS